jgi:hypothetical protein
MRYIIVQQRHYSGVLMLTAIQESKRIQKTSQRANASGCCKSRYDVFKAGMHHESFRIQIAQERVKP